MGRLFGNRHREYEELVTEHLDGRIDEAGAAKLQAHLASCDTCAADLRELEAVRTLLRAEPPVEAPRSFALPYAPRRAEAERSPGMLGWAGGRTAAWLRSMQVATAAAALVLIALISVEVVNTPSATTLPTAQTAPEAALAPQGTPAPQAAAAPEADGGSEAGLGDAQVAAEAESAVASEPGAEDAPPSLAAPAPETDPIVRQGLPPKPGDQPLEFSTDVMSEGAPEAAPAAPATVATGGRDALDWTLLACGVLTAVLALAVVALSLRRTAR
jgi:putative DNA primase/helicase